MKFDGFKWNFLSFKPDTFSWSHPHFMAIGPTGTKPSANKCRSLCKLISNSMHINLGQANEGIMMKLRYYSVFILSILIDWNECYNHRSCLERFGEDWSCHHCQISKGLTKKRATSLRHCPPRPCLSCLLADKVPNVLLMECSKAIHLRIMLHSDKVKVCN